MFGCPIKLFSFMGSFFGSPGPPPPRKKALGLSGLGQMDDAFKQWAGTLLDEAVQEMRLGLREFALGRGARYSGGDQVLRRVWLARLVPLAHWSPPTFFLRLFFLGRVPIPGNSTKTACPEKFPMASGHLSG